MDALMGQTQAELIGRAAAGDSAALVDLVWACVRLQFVGVTPFEAMATAEGFARLAAASGGAAESVVLAGVLRVRANHIAELGDTDRALSLFAQSEALCDSFASLPLSEAVEFLAGVLTAEADAGNEASADRLNKLTQALSAPDADKMRRAVNKACCDHRLAQEAALNG